jgi:CHAT domain-containing protein
VAAARPTEASPKLVGFGAPALKGAPLERRSAGGDPAEVFSGRLADPAKLAQLAYLPGAERELRYLEEHVSGALIRRGPQATETAVRVGDRAALERARYVVFSTHGLLASSRALTIDGGSSVGEPGLVLTPPATATEGDDGYLSASEAAQLRLSAEFVVLSACNTAASDGRPGGEGLSGLARAFFYAGARSLLVSHWEVSDEATTQLITAAFTGLDRQGASGRAAALRAAIRTVRARPGFSHPYYWAPFELVGEPAGDAGR